MVAVTVFGAAALTVAGLVILLLGVRSLLVRRRETRTGALVAVDEGPTPVPLLRSYQYGIVGRPDALRRLADGRLVPVEFKSRSTPAHGVPRSHRIQVAAYCLLVEETTGRSPPYGVIRYGDGGGFRIRWDARARDELLALRDDLERPYDGRATPSPARCLRCPWRDVCDVRAI
jgi:CRISPR-associated exonuclease Cas4